MDNKVYLLKSRHYLDDHPALEGVYASESTAAEVCCRLNTHPGRDGDTTYYVETMELNSA